MCLTSALDLGFILGTLIMGYRLFVSFCPSITPMLWVFWAGQLCATGQSVLVIAAFLGLALAGVLSFLQAPRHTIQYGIWAGRNAPMLSRWQLAGLPATVQLIDGRGLIFAAGETARYRPKYLHPHRLFYTNLSRYEPALPPPLSTTAGAPRRELQSVFVEWPYIARALSYTGAISALLGLILWLGLGHSVVAVMVLLFLTCIWAMFSLLLSMAGVILEDALHEDLEEDSYPFIYYA